MGQLRLVLTVLRTRQKFAPAASQVSGKSKTAALKMSASVIMVPQSLNVSLMVFINASTATKDLIQQEINVTSIRNALVERVHPRLGNNALRRAKKLRNAKVATQHSTRMAATTVWRIYVPVKMVKLLLARPARSTKAKYAKHVKLAITSTTPPVNSTNANAITGKQERGISARLTSPSSALHVISFSPMRGIGASKILTSSANAVTELRRLRQHVSKWDLCNATRATKDSTSRTRSRINLV